MYTMPKKQLQCTYIFCRHFHSQQSDVINSEIEYNFPFRLAAGKYIIFLLIISAAGENF